MAKPEKKVEQALSVDLLSEKEKKIYDMLVKAGTPKQEALESILGLTKAGERKLTRLQRMERVLSAVQPALNKLAKEGKLEKGDKFKVEVLEDGVKISWIGEGKGVGRRKMWLSIKGKETEYESGKLAAKALFEYGKGKLTAEQLKHFQEDLELSMNWHTRIGHYAKMLKDVEARSEGE